jgi:hypothetical protein
MKHTVILPCLGLLSLASAYAVDTPVAKPGTIAPVVLQATVVREVLPNPTGPVSGGTRTNFATTTVRFGTRDILAYMAVAHPNADATQTPTLPASAALLDGSVNGWSIARLADPTGAGHLYAIKNGKAAVAVPTYLLTAPVVTGEADAGTKFTPTNPATGVATQNITTKAYGTVGISNSTGTVSGTQALKTATVKIGTVTTPVLARTDNFTIIGQIALLTGRTVSTGTINASYRMPRATPANLGATLLPGAATP